MNGSRIARLALSALTLASVLALIAPTSVSAQTQIVTATPGYINLGMTTAITVTAPAAGTYSVVVDKPNGATSTLPYVFTTAGQTLNQTFGSATLGFTSVVNLVGTYNVFVTQAGSTIATTSFYATNKFTVSMDMVNGGTCVYIPGATRGTKMFPRFYIYFASNGAPATNNTAGIKVTFTMPDKTIATAGWDSGAHLFVGKVQPTWNYTYVGPWSPTANITDAAGNSATYTYTGTPFNISPVPLATNVVLTDATTKLPIAAIYTGETVNIQATITYPTNAEPVPGFVAPLDATARGGVVTALVGWGAYNSTATTFGGSAKSPGALIATVKLTYTGANGTWTGQFVATSLPTLPSGQTYAVAITATDKASPANTGLQIASLAPAPTPASIATTTVTSISSTTVTTSVAGAGSATTTTTTATSISTTISTTLSTVTSTLSQVVQSVPTIVYAGLAIILVLGLVIGMIVRLPRRE